MRALHVQTPAKQESTAEPLCSTRTSGTHITPAHRTSPHMYRRLLLCIDNSYAQTPPMYRRLLCADTSSHDQAG